MAEPVEQTTSEPDVPAPTPKRTPKPTARIKSFASQNPRLLAAGILFFAGIGIVMAGWYGTATTNILSQQIPFIVSGGFLGLGLIIAGAVFASAHVTESRTERMRRELLDAIGSAPLVEGTPGANGKRTAGTGTVFALEGGHSYHLAGCPIIEGKTTRETTARAAVSGGLAMCKLCGPE